MKKLMISTIILLPLIILAILLVSGAIIGMVTHIYVEQVEFVDNGTIKLVMDDEQTPPTHSLSVNVFPLKAVNRDLVFSTDDSNIVSVDDRGTVTARFYGKTKVRVRSVENNAAYDEVEVWVTDNSAHVINMLDYTEEMYLGETQKFTAQILPQEANNKNVIWQSDNPDILSVTAGGDAVCKGAGTVTVTVTSEDNPALTDTATIHCHLPLEGIDLEGNRSSFITALKKAQFPQIKFYPQSDDSYKVEYSSSDENIAHVDGNGAITFFGAGKVIVRVTVSDDRGHSYQKEATYNCTDGYFNGSLFSQTRYSFDYDELLDGNDFVQLPITLKKDPEGSYRQIVNVEVSNPIITFDGNAEKFVLHDSDETPLGQVTLTIHARKYNIGSEKIEDVTDVCYLTLTRNTRSLSFESDGAAIFEKTITESSINIREITGAASGVIGCVAYPQNHTDKLVFQVIEGNEIATLSNGVLRFSQEGFAVVQASIEGNTLVEPATVKITRVLPKPEESEVEINEETREVESFPLNYYNEQSKDTAFLNIQTSEGKVAVITTDKPDIVAIDEVTRRITPLKGGFVRVTVTFETVHESEIATLAVSDSISFTIYVDKPIEAKDITFDIDDDYQISTNTLEMTVFLNVAADVMEGKELYFDGSKVDWAQGEDSLVYHAVYNFAEGEQDKTLVTQVVYSDEAKQLVEDPNKTTEASLNVHTSRGVLLEGSQITVTCDGEQLQKEGNEIVFKDIYENVQELTPAKKVITVTVDKPVPADFVFDEQRIAEQILFDESDFYTVSVLWKSDNSAEVTLIVTNGGQVSNRPLTIAGQDYTVSVKAELPAHTISVAYSGRRLEQGTEYSTFQAELTLFVSLLRNDGKTVTIFDYAFNGETNSDNTEPSFNITVNPTADSDFTLTSGSAAVTVTIHKKQLKDFEFEYYLGYTNNGQVTNETFSFDAKQPDNNQKTLSFSSAVQGNFTVGIEGKSLSNLLGGFVLQDMKDAFSVTTDVTFTAEFNEDAAHITPDGNTPVLLFTVKFNDPYFFNATFDFEFGGNTFKFTFNCSSLQSVSFGEGFNSALSSDIYHGYQQVRVFAKHSFYGKLVDYFSVPISATDDVVTGENNLAAITWTLTKRQWDKDGTEKEPYVISEQRGTKVIYLGEEYRVVPQESGGPSKLVRIDYNEADGTHTETTVVENGMYLDGQTHVTWVDVYAEDGKAHIYFGDFGGLSETDVRNDYFGNFGDVEEGWKPTPDHANNYDNSGRDFAASENAYSFLLVNAGDGSTDSNGVSAHFNFNVMQDEALVNVFDATGFCSSERRKVVLHNNLYGVGELEGITNEQAVAADLILNPSNVANQNDNSITKEIIFGNGYQVNLKALSDKVTDEMLQSGKENTGKSTAFGTLYNVTLKGTNPHSEITPKNDRMLFVLSGAYYSNLEYYSKLNPSGGTVYLKNTVLRYVANAAIQLYTSGGNIYFENVVIAECMRAVSLEGGQQKNNLYFRGFFELLNYGSAAGIQSKFKAINGSDLYAGAITEEGGGVILGESMPGIKELAKSILEWFGSDGSQAQKEYRYYVNMGITEYMAKKTVYFWNDSPTEPGYTLDAESVSNPIKFANLEFSAMGLGITISTFDILNTIDGGSPDFTSRDTNLLFTEDRNIRLLCEYKTLNDTVLVKNTDHIMWHINQVHRDTKLAGVADTHIENLKASLDDPSIVWPDGTKPYDILHP